MKKIAIILFSLCLCVCSCKKAPQELLIGTWKVNKAIFTISAAEDSSEIIQEPEEMYYLFAKGGSGKYWSKDTEKETTYTFKEETNSLFITGSPWGSDWTINVLTKDELIFHTSFITSIMSAKIQVFCTRVK